MGSPCGSGNPQLIGSLRARYCRSSIGNKGFRFGRSRPPLVGKPIMSSEKAAFDNHSEFTNHAPLFLNNISTSMRNIVKYYSPTTNVCIIRVARDQHRIAWGAVTLLSSIEGQKYIPNVVHVSGA